MNLGLWTGESAQVNRNLELSDLELSEVNLVTLWRKKIETGGKTRFIRKFELNQFELTSFNCIRSFFGTNQTVLRIHVHVPLIVYICTSQSYEKQLSRIDIDSAAKT